MKIGIVYDRKKPEAKKLALEVRDWLKEKKHQIFLRLGNSVLEDLDFVITFGGDGLILHTANKVAAYKTPLLRVNFGYVGFLANVKPAEIFEKLSAMLGENNYIIVKRTRIEILVKDKEGNLLARKDALNDIVAERVDTQAIACEVVVDGERNEYRGDGIIFATRTGSTAYAESAGGPTLIKDDKFILRVISPSNREQMPYLIKSDNFVFEVRKVSGKARLAVDGKKIAVLRGNEQIAIQRSLRETFFIEVGDVPKIKEEL
ncbi:NAD(+)/NADH kinase [Candidatus Parcubacteria bacterium]|nr:NAD(+)/NADH kinase [Candidatus Parcubacteria bacterium]